MSEAKRYAIYSTGRWEVREVKAGAWVRWYDFDAQRLRADMAEAESARIKNISDNYYALLVDANQKLGAAEQRVADLESAAQDLINTLYLESSECAEAIERYRAAINPNPETESHD